MSEITVTLPDGNKMKIKKGSTVHDVAKKIGEGLARAALAGKLDTIPVDLATRIEKDAKIEIITPKSKEALEILRHSAAHVLAEAVIELYPDAKPTIGPAIENGFYYDFHVKKPFTPEDLEKIEKRMADIIKKDNRFERTEMERKQAIDYYKKQQNKFKQEIIDDHKEDKVISFYKSGNFHDLCRGPHIPSTSKIGAIKLTKISSAYWRGSDLRESLQRIYGVAFFTKKELEAHLKLLEEAEKRDHRKLGKQLDLFSVHDEAPGFPFFHPKGTIIWSEIEKFWRELHTKRGYVLIKTPLILNKKLWLQSGHWDHYKDNMYFTKIDGEDYAVKPMNCPGGMLLYKEKSHSYKEFPMRVAELGTVHRHELSGVLTGLFRVRCFTQDDAHIFMMPSQIKEEVLGVIDLVDYLYKIFGFEYHIELSTKPQKAMGSDEIWETATNALKDALESKSIPYKINEGDGAFYGPKIDFHLTDCIGRTWQCGTVQLDFLMPERFDLTYVGEDNEKHRPVMLHRVVLGSFERFIGILIEHYAGAFPLWLSPIQLKVIPVADRHRDYAEKVKEKLLDSGFRVESDYRQEKVEHKIRDAQLEKINYMLVVGDKEIEKGTITSRTREGIVTFNIKLDEFIKSLDKEIESKK
ncbi:MAG: threonine--tRNA ligase [archaeon]